MTDLPFNQDAIDWVRDKRTDFLTSFFRFFTFLGSEMGYILLVLGIYWLYNKNVALRLTIVTIFSSALNQMIKVIVRNPRPYVNDGTYQDNWAINEDDIELTATEFSTPSGHAMGAASFWLYLNSKIKSPKSRIIAIVMILLIGLSRPYLGVHYFEDIILGWGFGIIITYFILVNEDKFVEKWQAIPITLALGVIVGSTFLMVLIAGLLSNFGPDGEIFATLAGMITGLILGYNLENKYVGFEAETKSLGNAIVRVIIGLFLSFSILFGLDAIFANITDDLTFLGFILRYVRYSALGIFATFVSGYVFVKMGVADSNLDV
ncbi:MAG: hypothetical protein HeimC2_10230 [Candidatus Heimdallarchaeota archaeon LC_2]|nr:MAG: hypothetical protein HeimC2_10230 [Candidatus Heimdallarchaeota archaeon LC_2]